MRRLRLRLRRIVHHALALLLPFRCAACGCLEAPGPPAPSAEDPNALAAAQQPLMRLLCRDCRDTILPVTAPQCSVCGIPFVQGAGIDHRCGDCTGSTVPLERMRAAAVYQGAMVLMVRQFKYHHAVHLGAAMRPWLSAVYHRHWRPGAVGLVVPVPLHRLRLRQRGYNQAWLLARQVFGPASMTHAPLLRHDVLVRLRDTPSQTGLDRDRRRRNMKGAFSVADAKVVAGKHVLVVDDVVTTGETMAACAGVLLAAGARRVDALSMARTLRRLQ
ncbi:MAG: phosphoribosyltransferase family protein [Pseudomonadota bacterium]